MDQYFNSAPPQRVISCLHTRSGRGSLPAARMLHLRRFKLLSSGLLLLFLLTVDTAVRTEAREPPHVIGSGRPIRAAPGDDIILPCQLEPKYNVEALTVEWSRTDLKPDPVDRLSRVEYVHLYRDRREVPDMKIRSYLWRTELFTDRLMDGNISLKIRNVTLADQGTYRCFIPKLRSSSIVQLDVAPQSDESFMADTSPDPRKLPNLEECDEMDVEGGRLHLIALIPVAVCVLLILAGGACLALKAKS